MANQMMNEEMVLDMLSKSEYVVYEYIKHEAQRRGGTLKESMSEIGKKIDVSEATVHRSVRKLRKSGIIGIVPSMEKAESNEIVYYGLPDQEQQVTEIMSMVQNLNSSVNRFQIILAAKDNDIQSLQRDKEILYGEIDKLQLQLKEQVEENQRLQSLICQYESKN